MKNSGLQRVLTVLEVAVTAILFVLMLITCGRYIDIRINGRTNTLSSMPQTDKRILLQIGTGNTLPNNELIQPVFSGVKTEVGAYAVDYSDSSRQSIRKVAYEYIPKLFSGKHETKSFKTAEERNKYIASLKSSQNYILLCFLTDVPASAVLPCLSEHSENASAGMYFNVQSIFIMPNEAGNAVGIAISSDLQINVLTPAEQIVFNAKELEAYNSSTGFVAFEFAQSNYILPQLVNTVKINDYSINTAFKKMGNNEQSPWILKTLSAFSINKNLAKTFVNRNRSVISFVDGENELVFSDNGNVQYSTTGKGISLYEYLGYNSEDDGYSFHEKITAVKKLLNSLDKSAVGDKADFCISGVYYQEANEILSLEMKYLVNGICITNDGFDAEFKIKKDNIVNAQFKAISCTRLNSFSNCMPQKYAEFLTDRQNEIVVNYALLSPKNHEENDMRYGVVWAVGTNAK